MKLLKHPRTWVAAIAMSMIGAISVQAAPQDENNTQPRTQINQRIARPTAKINTDFAGWQEATADGKVGQNLRANWVMLNDSNGVDGQVIGITEPMNVHMLRNGFVVGRTTTQADGQFQMESAVPGPYTLVGYSPDAIFAFNFIAVANDGEATGMPLSIQTRPVTGAENVKVITRLIKENAPTVSFAEYGDYDSGESKDDSPANFGWDGLSNLTEVALPSTTIRSHAVSIQSGTFIGRIHQMHNRSGRPVEVKNSTAILVYEGAVAGTVQVDNAGIFTFRDIPAGDYGFVSVGADGILVVGVELVDRASAVPSANSEANSSYDPLFRNIAHQESVVFEDATTFDATLSNPDSVGWINSHVEEQTYVNAMNQPMPEMANLDQMPYNYFDNAGMYSDMGGFGSGGGYGGGGGGGGGGFGLGNLILPIGVGAIIAEAASNNNNDNIGVIRLVSPFQP